MADFSLQVNAEALRQFHAHHFPNQNPLDLVPSGNMVQNDEEGQQYYEDGVKRTLTDEQIAMFRHSEIQKLKRNRRRKLRKLQPSKHVNPNIDRQDEVQRKDMQLANSQREPERREIGKPSTDSFDQNNVVLRYDEVENTATSSSSITFHWPKLG